MFLYSRNGELVNTRYVISFKEGPFGVEARMVDGGGVVLAESVTMAKLANTLGDHELLLRVRHEAKIWDRT